MHQNARRRTLLWVTVWVKMGNGYMLRANMASRAADDLIIITGEQEAVDLMAVLTGRDSVALEVLRCAILRGENRTDLVQWAFAIADQFVAQSNARWAKMERAGDGEGGQRNST
jgi:hypothetical protein